MTYFTKIHTPETNRLRVYFCGKTTLEGHSFKNMGNRLDFLQKG